MGASKKLRSAFLLASCIAVLLVTGAAEENEEEKAPAVERLLLQDSIKIKKAQDELVAARKDLIAQLIAITQETENRVRRSASVRAAMCILGEMRAVEAVQLLTEHIAFPHVREKWPEPYPGPAGLGAYYHTLEETRKVYPAVDALIKIGEPCLDAVMERLISSYGMLEEHACLGVLAGLRKKQEVADMLTTVLEAEEDAKRQKRLIHSLKTLDEMTKAEDRRKERK